MRRSPTSHFLARPEAWQLTGVFPKAEVVLAASARTLAGHLLVLVRAAKNPRVHPKNIRRCACRTRKLAFGIATCHLPATHAVAAWQKTGGDRVILSGGMANGAERVAAQLNPLKQRIERGANRIADLRQPVLDARWDGRVDAARDHAVAF